MNTPLGLPGQQQAICTRTFYVPLHENLPHKQPEIHYYATSLSPHEASPKHLAQMIRDHWLVENLVHHVKDRTFLEDRHWLKNPQTACTFTALRTLATDMLRQTRIPDGTGREHCPAKIEYMQADVQRPIRWVTNKK